MSVPATESQPVIVALHGFLSSSNYWSRLERQLRTAGFNVVAIDLLGFGKADKPSDSAYDYDSHVAYIHEALCKRGINQPFILMGHSMGALIAARFANMHPKKVARTILLHPPVYTSSEEARQTLRSTGMVYRFLLDSRFRGIAWGILRNVTFSVIARHTKQSREQSLKNIIEAAELFNDLAAATAPTLLFNGTKDRYVYGTNLRHAKDLKNIRVSHANVAHHSPIFKTKLVAGTISRFVSNP